MVLLSGASVALGWLAGARTFWLGFPLGLGLVMVLRLFTYSFFHNFEMPALGNPVFYGLLGAALLIAVWRARPGDRFWSSVGIAVGLGLLAAVATRVFGVQGTNHGDSLWILSVAHLLDINGNLHFLSGHTPIKRGFLYPLMLALGDRDEYLTSFPPFVFAALAAATVWLTTELTKRYDWRRTATVAVLLVGVTLTARMPLLSIFYINGHTLTALGVMLTAGAVILAVRDEKLSAMNLLLACTGIFIISGTRVEGIAFAAILSLPLLSRRWIKRWQIMVIISSATVPLTIWLLTYHSYIARLGNRIPELAFAAILLIAGLVPAAKIFDWFRFRSVWIGVVPLVLMFVGAQLAVAGSLKKGNESLVKNLILGQGSWGALVLLLPLTLAFVDWRKLSSEVKSLGTILFSMIMAALVVKMLDGGQFGHPTLGRPGWSDSLNRMWIHFFALLLVVAATALIENDKLWMWLPQAKSKPKKAVKS